MTDDLISRAAALDALDRHMYADEARGEIEALPAVAASQPADPTVKADSCQQVRVKPLVWAFSKSTQAHRADSQGSGEIYLAWEMANGWVLSMKAGNTTHPTIEDAKAAAQADYEARILAAIETQPDPRDAVIAGLVDALEYADRMVRLDLIHMTDFDHDDFSQAVVDTGKRIAAAQADYEARILAAIETQRHPRHISSEPQ